MAMFGATFLVPVITGFPPATTLLFSGLGTLLFLVITGNRLPSYLGSSFAIIAPVLAATASDGMGAALGGIVGVGLLLIVIGVVVNFAGTRWIEALMPPVVTGTIVALIGLDLAPTAKMNWQLPSVGSAQPAARFDRSGGSRPPRRGNGAGRQAALRGLAHRSASPAGRRFDQAGVYGGATPQPQRGVGSCDGGSASGCELANAIRVPHSM